MVRGIISGLVFGGVLGLLVAAVVSLLSPLPANVVPPMAESPSASQPQTAGSAPLQSGSTTDAPVQADSVAQAPTPAQGLDAAPNADVAPAPKPTPGSVADGQVAPAPVGNAAVSVQDESPVLPSPQAQAITVPGSDDEPSISVDPAQPQSPAAPETTGFGAPTLTPEPAAPTAEAEAARSPAPAQQDVAGADSAPTVDAANPTPREEVAALAPEAAPDSRLKPATDLNAAFPQRTSSRLPRIGEEADAPAEEEAAMAEAQTPLEAHRQLFEGTEGKPMLSVLLLDDPESDVDLATLADFPVPLSIAVDALHPEAAARMATYRGFGLEVFAVLNLPAGVSASEVEVNVAAQLAAVPQAVGILEGLNGGLQENRAVAEQVIDATLASGHGLVMQPKGLNTAQKLAAREGVPSITVFRDFDGKGQTQVVMRRFLDQAAFKAGQADGVVMMGRLQADTIAALASWALQDRASTVDIAPVSAILLQQNGA